MADLSQGTLVNNRYTLLEYKGRGSFGEVWLAHDNTLGIDVALKIYISLDQRGVDEFKSEYTNTLGLSHPNLLVASFFDVWDSRPFLVMRFCESGSSTGLVGKATELQVWQFLHDVASGLAYLHDLPEPIIHQDIKPDNILIGGEDTYLITDFGISKRVRATMRKQSKRAVGAGATAYMGPERFGEDSSPVKASDVWSLGISAYELATGELPFSGLGGGMQRNGAERPNLPEGWSKNLNDLIRRCIDKETWDRPTAQQIADYTREVLNGNDISYEVWKNGPTTASKKSLKKVIFGIAGGLVVLAGIIIGIIALTGNKVKVEDNNEDLINNCKNLYSMCDNDIKVGSDANYQALIMAKNLLDSLNYYKEENPNVAQLDSIDTDGLESRLAPKLASAAEAWKFSAESQWNIASNAEEAISHYHIAALLKDNPDIAGALEKIGNATGCKGAPIIVTKATIDGDKMKIVYTNLSSSPVSDLKVVYDLMDDKKSLQTAQSTLTFAPGKGKTLSIMLEKAPAKTPTTVAFKSNNIQFACPPVTQ